MENNKSKSNKYSFDRKALRADVLRDIETALDIGKHISSRRIQVKMPGYVVDEIDDSFPNEDRSKIITRAAIDFLRKKDVKKHSIMDLFGVWSDEYADEVWEAIKKARKYPSRPVEALN